jgi:hypothetical protein
LVIGCVKTGMSCEVLKKLVKLNLPKGLFKNPSFDKLLIFLLGSPMNFGLLDLGSFVLITLLGDFYPFSKL